MNYLGHAFLSFENPEITTGNMIGDFVKGKNILDSFPDGIRKGIMLHRKIDSFTDAHVASLRAKNLFRNDYRLYSGVFVDGLYDHFLANDPRYFSSEKELLNFTIEVYATLNKFTKYLPLPFQQVLPYMLKENWLYNYRTLNGLKKSFKGIGYRAKYLESTDRAYDIFVSHYYELNQRYFEFIDDMVLFVKNELNSHYN